MGPRPNTIRILIADDHPLLRAGLRRFLESQPEMKVVGEAEDGKCCLQLLQKLRPDLLLLDLTMPRLHGMEVLRRIGEDFGELRTMLLVASIERKQIVEALQLGARGVVLKDAATEILLKAIRAVMAGQYWVGRESVADLVQYSRELISGETNGGATRLKLTSRELEILAAIVAGYTNREVAQKLSLSVDTVKHHVSHIFDKTGCANRLELAMFTVNHRLLK